MTVEVSKTTAFAVLKPATTEVHASKVTAYAVLKVAASDTPKPSLIILVQ